MPVERPMTPLDAEAAAREERRRADYEERVAIRNARRRRMKKTP